MPEKPVLPPELLPDSESNPPCEGDEVKLPEPEVPEANDPPGLPEVLPAAPPATALPPTDPPEAVPAPDELDEGVVADGVEATVLPRPDVLAEPEAVPDPDPLGLVPLPVV